MFAIISYFTWGGGLGRLSIGVFVLWLYVIISLAYILSVDDQSVKTLSIFNLTLTICRFWFI